MTGVREEVQQPANRKILLLEYYFALGVFLGFCLACTVTDCLLGMPLRSIVVTVTVAITWALLMVYCGSAEYDDEEVESSHGRKGKVITVMIV